MRYKSGYKISLQALTKLLDETPKQLKIETMQAICTAFNCKLSDFCEVVSDLELIWDQVIPSSAVKRPSTDDLNQFKNTD
ncbi:hypothetical protein PCC7424_5826 (plasmid) [Gloeothece citriformis PCC 7424]|uniref:HTH cro/C1-type domain-containing protein n=2 Tax=Gloeothece TaxID=28070 RepID=B7KM62_GLOC7|nr:hypothetical protein PCC7424_5826 [Gloeothece citriformis PCC 7424]